MSEFESFKKIPRLTREITITEKIDGTNAQIYITEEGDFFTGSRNRWITPEDDNYGFSKWSHDNKEELLKLGQGRHFGEWWGKGIQKGHGNKEKTFSLFNTSIWSDDNIRPSCCSVVPVLYGGDFNLGVVEMMLTELELGGSRANPECKTPEGIIIYHKAAGMYFKKTLKGDSRPKGLNNLNKNRS